MTQRVTDDKQLIVFPAEDTTWDTQITLSVDGIRWRCDYDGLAWFDHQLVPRRTSHAYDGEELRQLRRENPTGAPFQQGLIGSVQVSHLADWNFRPVGWCFWPLEPARGGIDIRNARVLNETRQLDDAELVGLEESLAGETWRYWLDPQKNYAIRRAEQELPSGQLGVAISATYRNEGNLLVPDSWKLQYFEDTMALHGQWEATNIRFVLQPDYDAGFFHLEFPTHSVVHDARSGKDYLVKSDGEWYPIPRAGFNHAELVSSVEGDWTSWLVWGNCALIVAIVALVARRKWPRK